MGNARPEECKGNTRTVQRIFRQKGAMGGADHRGMGQDREEHRMGEEEG